MPSTVEPLRCGWKGGVMIPGKRKALERSGWRVGGVREFLGLTRDEEVYIGMKLALAGQLRKRRQARGLTQETLSRRLRSSQSRVAKMEAGDRTVSLDLLIRSLISLGMTPSDLARTLRPVRGKAA